MSGPITGPVTVASGAVCSLEAASVNGGVTVDKGGTLLMQNSIASGDVVCNGCGAPAPPKLCGASAPACGGAVNFMNATTLGNLTVDGATDGSAILSSSVLKDLTVLEQLGQHADRGQLRQRRPHLRRQHPAADDRVHAPGADLHALQLPRRVGGAVRHLTVTQP